MIVIRNASGETQVVTSIDGYDPAEWQDIGALPDDMKPHEVCVSEAGDIEIDLAAAWVGLRAERDRRISACDWAGLTDVPIETAEPWRAYRQELRDMPDATTDPLNPTWPTPPS